MSMRSALLALAVLLLAAPALAQTPAFCPARASVKMRRCDSFGPAGTPFTRGVNCRILDHQAFPREYVVYVPHNVNFDETIPAPVVVMHHGSGGDAWKFLKISGWREKAEQVGLVAVFPTALPAWVLDEERAKCSTKWNYYALPAVIDPSVPPRAPGPSGPIDWSDPAFPADDVGFVAALLDAVQAGLPVDPERIFVSGFSVGGAFAHRVAVELPARVAAAAFVSYGIDGVHAPTRRMPVKVMLGACDQKIAAALAGRELSDAEIAACKRGTGGKLEVDPVVLTASLLEALQTFGLEPVADQVVEEPTYTRLGFATPSAGNADGNLLLFSLLDGVTHQYPRCRKPGMRCNNPERFSAADRFWQFFSRCTLSGGCG